MAAGDVYTLQWVGEQQGKAMGTTINLRANQDAAPGLELSTLLDLIETEILPKVILFTSSSVTFTCIAARRITGITTANEVRFVNVDGALPGDVLPTTVYQRMRYYSIPYQARQSFACKFPGVPESDCKDGQLTLTHLLRFGDLINFLLTNPLTFAGNSYNWCTTRAYAGEPEPWINIRKANVVPCVFHIGSRQSNLCGS